MARVGSVLWVSLQSGPAPRAFHLVLPLRRLTYDVYDAGPSRAPTTVFAVPWLGALAGIGVAYEFR